MYRLPAEREMCLFLCLRDPSAVRHKNNAEIQICPHPFVIDPPPERRRGYKPGDEIQFSLTLIGRAIDYLPYFIYTFDELGKMGIGKGKARFELQDVSCDGKTIYDSESKTLKPFNPSDILIPHFSKGGLVNLKGLSQDLPTEQSEVVESGLSRSPIAISFITPTRIIYDGHLTLDLEFHILIRNLLRRLSLLSYFHCGGDPSEWDFKGIIEKAKKIRVKKRDLRWYDWERYSGRQETRMKMGGFVGEITFEGDIDPFIPFIKAGEVLHVGKGTGFGLGKYRIVTGVSNEV